MNITDGTKAGLETRRSGVRNVKAHHKINLPSEKLSAIPLGHMESRCLFPPAQNSNKKEYVE